MSTNPRLLDEKIAIVTGASRGIGAATARAFADAGATLILAARDEQALASLADEIHAAGGQALAVATDVGDPTSVERLVAQTIESHGRLDIASTTPATSTGQTRWPRSRPRNSTGSCEPTSPASSSP